MKTNRKHLFQYWLALALAMILTVILAACSSTSASTPTPVQPPATAPAQVPPSSTPSPNTSASRQGMSAGGTIANINGDTLTLNTTQGEATVNISSNTSIQKTIAGTLEDLQTGQFLTVIGTADAEGNIIASSITVRSQDQNFPVTPPGGASSNSTGRFNVSNNGSNPRPSSGGLRNGAFGTLAKIDSNILTLTTAQGQQMTVTVSSNTTIQKTVSGIISDLQVGETLTVIGPRDADGNINSVSIIIRPQDQNTLLSPPS